MLQSDVFHRQKRYTLSKTTTWGAHARSLADTSFGSQARLVQTGTGRRLGALASSEGSNFFKSAPRLNVQPLLHLRFAVCTAGPNFEQELAKGQKAERRASPAAGLEDLRVCVRRPVPPAISDRPGHPETWQGLSLKQSPRPAAERGNINPGFARSSYPACFSSSTPQQGCRLPCRSASRSATGSCSGTPTRSVSKEPRIREEARGGADLQLRSNIAEHSRNFSQSVVMHSADFCSPVVQAYS